MIPKLEAIGIEKRFGGVHALRGVDIAIASGTVHALVGENGAGKSTLGKVLSGLIAPDMGEIRIDGRLVHFRNPAEALQAGIAIVSQELMLVPELSLAENVYLGMERRGRAWGMLPPADEAQRFSALADEVGLDFPATYKAGRLRVADQQKLEIMRALARNAEVIVMDEPTAALGASDGEMLHRIIGELRSRGKTIIYVSHFLDDVLDIADTITVLRDGQLIRTAAAAGETEDCLVEAMLGRPLELSFPAKALPKGDGPALLKVTELGRDREFDGISFELRAGEILGVAGLVGSGRTEVARAIYGAEPLHRGQMWLGCKAFAPRSPSEAIRAGVALLPESRKDQGLLLQQSIGENIGLPHLGHYARSGVLDKRHLAAGIDAVLRGLAIKAEDQHVAVSKLSGGNQQKVVLGRWMLKSPRVLIADEPTRGVDVGAKAAIYGTLTRLAAAGMGIIIISSELEELLGLAHRAIVMKAGRCAAELGPEALTESAVLQAAFGAER